VESQRRRVAESVRVATLAAVPRVGLDGSNQGRYALSMDSENAMGELQSRWPGDTRNETMMAENQRRAEQLDREGLLDLWE
jgi:hypothetical protein